MRDGRPQPSGSCWLVAGALTLSVGLVASGAPAGGAESNPATTEQPSAILVQPIHDAQVVPGDDGRTTSSTNSWSSTCIFEPVTLTSVTVLDPAGKELGRIDGATLAAATQALLRGHQHPRSTRRQRSLSMSTWPWSRAPHRIG